MKLSSQASTISKQCEFTLDIHSLFWQEWQQYRDYLYRCCIKWMGGNPTDAEDALSRAMLKAWEKVQKYAGQITNFKAWLTTLTRNLCVDIHRERSRGANRVEDIEVYASGEEEGLVSFEDTPESAVETGEKRMVIRRAINNLVTRLRETFILHFYQEFSYQEIAQQQDISYQNVCKRISQARKILQEELRGYFIEEEGTDTDKFVTLTATESEIGEMSESNGGVEADAGETVLAVAVEEAQEVARDVQHSESASVAATSDGKVEVKSDGCRWVEAALCEREQELTLASEQVSLPKTMSQRVAHVPNCREFLHSIILLKAVASGSWKTFFSRLKKLLHSCRREGGMIYTSGHEGAKTNSLPCLPP